jgi:hypothetical protein
MDKYVNELQAKRLNQQSSTFILFEMLMSAADAKRRGDIES